MAPQRRTPYLFDVSRQSGEVLATMIKVQEAYDRYFETLAMLKVLENPGASNLPPEYVEALGRVCDKAKAAEPAPIPPQQA